MPFKLYWLTSTNEWKEDKLCEVCRVLATEYALLDIEIIIEKKIVAHSGECGTWLSVEKETLPLLL